LLRDGDPSSSDPNASEFAIRYRKQHGGRDARWLPTDFRQPHHDAYAALMLALGTGLRANEIDKARWNWLKFDAKGDCYLEVRAESDFKPKGGTLRLIKIPSELFDALTAKRQGASSPYIIGGEASPAKGVKGENYRRPETFRAVNAWLRARGVESEKKRGHPLHRLRKQFGSEIATSAGLFAAQKLLGHSSPTVTAKYYAAQTDLPTLTHVRIVG
jgi:integrase